MRNLGLSLTFWLAGILLSTNSFALGLGEIQVNSFLNQPLEAKIEVISARGGEIDNLLVTLASREAFTRAGLSRPRSLSELRFSVQVDEETATAVVLVTTKSAVKEPFLNFLVEADWAKGRVLREFTVLLDPPFYANTPTPAPSSDLGTETSEIPQEASTAGVIAHSEPTTSSSDTSEQSSSDSMESEVEVSETSTMGAAVPDASLNTQQSITEQQSFSEPTEVVGEPGTDTSNVGSEVISERSDSMIVSELQVVKGDTLWNIATQFKDSRHSMSQVMLALQQMNPEAFGDNNINFLKVGSVLRAPGAEQLDGFGEQEAIAEVLEQNGLWDGYVENLSQSTAVSMAGDGGDGGAGDTAAEEQSNLSLLTPGENESDTSGVQGDEESMSRLSAQLALAEEELDAARIENSELESRISELEATLSKVQELQRMVEIEDDSMAQLQENQNEETAATEAEEMDQASLETISAEPTGTTEALTEEMNSVDEEALLEELLAEEPDSVAGQAETDSEGLELEPVAEATQPAESVEEQTTVPAPVIITEPAQISDSFLEGIPPSLQGMFRDPLLLGGVGGILILLLGLFGYKKWQGKRGVVDLGESDAGEDSTAVDDAHAIDGTEIDDDPSPLLAALEEAVDEAIQEEAGEDTNVVPPNAEELPRAEKAPAEESDFSDTEIFSPESADEALTQETKASVAGQEAEVEQQDDTLNEVDVYLAYGLYDNAEELLKQSLEASPNRADYRSKLLDTYFATKNITEFVKQAETLKGMGDAAGRHWDRVQVMGYELAPDNALFSGAKDSTLSTTDLGIAKPEAADFDLGSGEEKATHFGADDFLLTEGSEEIEEADALTDTQAFVETVAREDEVVQPLESTPAFAEEDDDLSDLEFAFDADDEGDEPDVKSNESDGMDFDLPDDMDDADSASDVEEEFIDFDMDEALNLDDEAAAVTEDDGAQIEETIVIDPEAYPELNELGDMPGLEDTDGLEDKSETRLETDPDENISEIEPEIGGISETGDTSLGLDDGLDISEVDEPDLEDQTDISEIDLGIDDISAADPEIEIDTDDFNLDLDGKPTKTDTFAPGDFDDPEEILPDETNIEGVNIDDIDDLLLPDDVDEVSTKLDLARAFIDMGDSEGARSSLEEVMSEGNDEQKAEAETLMKQV